MEINEARFQAIENKADILERGINDCRAAIDGLKAGMDALDRLIGKINAEIDELQKAKAKREKAITPGAGEPIPC